MIYINKCNGENCPIKLKCYRYTAKSGFWQSWINNPGKLKDNVFSCELYLRESLFKDLVQIFDNN